MNTLLIVIASLIVFASMSLFGYLVTVVALAFGAIFVFCLMTNRLLTEFIYTNSINDAAAEKTQKDSK